MAQNFWLIKSEPDVYSISDLERDRATEWGGVRNYKARNLMRDRMAVGDGVLYYHSNTDPLGVYGLAEVASEAHPDSTQFDPKSPYHETKTSREDPRWWCVDVRHMETLDAPVTREAMKTEPGLADMMVLKRGARLSVQPVTRREYEIVLRMARR